MRIGPLYITWMTSKRMRLVSEVVRDELRSDAVRNSVARLARGEVKDYLAELAEGAEMPFFGPGAFLQRLGEMIRTTAATGPAEPPRCDARPYPAGSEGDDGTACVLPRGHAGKHRDWVDELDGGAGFGPGDDEGVASNLLFENDAPFNVFDTVRVFVYADLCRNDTAGYGLCTRLTGHAGDHSDANGYTWARENDEPAEPDEQPDHYSPGDEGVRAHRWADEKPSS